VRDAALSGARVRVRVAQDLVDPEERITRALSEGGVAAGPVRAIRPSLEDVFVALVGEAGEAAA